MKNQNGHTLLELIFVIVLIGISFPGLLAFFANGVTDSVKNEITSKAIVLARIKMEEITADKRDLEKGISYVKTPGIYTSETIGHYDRFVSVKDYTFAGINGINVVVTIRHPLLGNNFTLTHFFTNQDVY